MKIIFLDIDGVLNDTYSNASCCGLIGIDDKKVKKLATIVEKTNAKIVLCSSWKINWERVNKEDQHAQGTYLDKKLRKCNLYILDKTIDNGSNRGYGINKWLENKHNIESWIVLDDDIFKDYIEENIIPHLVKTNFSISGLDDEHVEKAILLLNGEI